MGRTPLRTRLIAVVALIALAATYLTPVVNVEWAGWRHDHGHLTAGGVVPPHSHPWDAAAPRAPLAAPGTDTEGHAMVFTASGDSVPGVTALWVIAPALLAFAAMLLAGCIALVIRPVSPYGPTAHPPPKALLSAA
jgi:hypothetical protein